ncbi:MAG TPA: AMMECR1 domain-containing protein, partial [Pyrinomonadaceae bacterium]
IEGAIDPGEPVVLIDDSVSSGISMEEATARLEEAGLRVEGGICLVRFGWYGGYARMQERGYHMEAVYDIWDDFISVMPNEEKPLANPSKWFPRFEWHAEQAPEGLHPAQLARVVIAEYLSSGRLLRAPLTLDQEYDSSGGVWVSLRSRANVHQRFARGGFWHFPHETPGTAAEDAVMGSLSTAAQLAKGDDGGEEGLKIVEQSAIAVTFFGALERCTPGQLDNDRYGIVVRSLERREKMGGALPRMPGIRNEWHQFQHARIKNAKLVSFEPYELFRHDVVKAIEPDAAWQPSGVPIGESIPWHKDTKICGRVAERTRDLVLAQLFERSENTLPVNADLLPKNVDSCYVTVYIDGQLRGCMGTKIRELDQDLKRMAEAAVRDQRFSETPTTDPDAVAVSVSLLYDSLVIGQAAPEEIVNYYRHGEQTLMAFQGEQVGVFLPFVASTWNLDPVSFAKAVLEKAKLSEPPYNWCRLDCTTWLADRNGTWPTLGAFPLRKIDRSPDDLIAHHIALHRRYLLKHLREDGTFFSRYQPFHNRLFEGVDLPRQAYGAWVFARAHRVLGGDDLRNAASAVINSLNQFETETVAVVSFELLALCELPLSDPRRSKIKDLADKLWQRIDLPHGRVTTHFGSDPSPEAFQDYFPGQLLLALANACAEKVTEVDHERLQSSFRYYRHRFRYQRHFGQVTWLLQAFSKWWEITREQAFADFVFEVADWLLGYQQEKSGAFINDHQSETPGYTTAVYLEGLAAALSVTARVPDATRHQAYRRAFANGVAFLDQLIIQERDQSILPSPDFALGGLRQGLYYSEIRTDFVQHSLSALLARIDGPAPFTV